MNRSSEVDPTSVARLLWINLLTSDAFGRLQGRFALEIGREKQARKIKGTSHAKGAENDTKWTPRGCLREHPGLRKQCPQAQKVLFRMRILGVYCRRPPGPHFLRNRIGRAWPESCLDRAGASGSHVGSRRKKSSPGQVFRRFRCRFGGPAGPLGRLFPQKAVKCGRWLRSRFRSYENHRTPARLKSSQTSKAI